jgi:hypothetical protein
MELKSTRMAMTVVVAALCGCAGLLREKQAPVERLDEHGVSAPALTVESGTILQFVNADSRPHQIYSNDCSELSSTVLKPGDIHAAGIGIGPKDCHFQDLLLPLSTGYSGTVQVHDEQEERRRATED